MRTQERDAEFELFYHAQLAPLRRLALFLSGGAADADDLAQEALLRTYTSWARIHRAEPGPYARRTLVNLCRSKHRRKLLERRRPAERDPSTVQPDVAEALDVAKALGVLSPVKRAVVVLRFYEDMSEAEIAHVLDRPLNTVKSDLRRALIRLRAELDEEVTAR